MPLLKTRGSYTQQDQEDAQSNKLKIWKNDDYINIKQAVTMTEEVGLKMVLIWQYIL